MPIPSAAEIVSALAADAASAGEELTEKLRLAVEAAAAGDPGKAVGYLGVAGCAAETIIHAGRAAASVFHAEVRERELQKDRSAGGNRAA